MAGRDNGTRRTLESLFLSRYLCFPLLIQYTSRLDLSQLTTPVHQIHPFPLSPFFNPTSIREIASTLSVKASRIRMAPSAEPHHYSGRETASTAYESIASSTLSFYLNGSPVSLEGNHFDPDTSLLSFIRSQPGLTGTKLGCGEGGCGACIVVLQAKHPKTGQITHSSINSCLTPLVAVDGKHVLTVEALGDEYNPHPLQERLAKLSGSQVRKAFSSAFMFLLELLSCIANSVDSVHLESSCRSTHFYEMQLTKESWKFPMLNWEDRSTRTFVDVLATHRSSELSNPSLVNTWHPSVSRHNLNRPFSLSLTAFPPRSNVENGAGLVDQDFIVPFNYEDSGLEPERVHEAGSGCCKGVNPAAEKVAEVSADGESCALPLQSTSKSSRDCLEQSRFLEKRSSNPRHLESILYPLRTSDEPHPSTLQIKTCQPQLKSSRSRKDVDERTAASWEEIQRKENRQLRPYHSPNSPSNLIDLEQNSSFLPLLANTSSNLSSSDRLRETGIDQRLSNS